MPVRYRYSPDRIIVFQYVEPVTFEEWRATFEAAYADPEYGPDVRVLVDRRAAKPPDPGFIEQIAAVIRNRPELVRQHPLAIVVAPHDPVAINVGGMLETFVENPRARFRTFDNYAEALAWLKTQPERKL